MVSLLRQNAIDTCVFVVLTKEGARGRDFRSRPLAIGLVFIVEQDVQAYPVRPSAGRCRLVAPPGQDPPALASIEPWR